MPTCVECGAAVSTLYTEYSRGNIRLTPCDHCRHFADKYIEHDLVTIFIDMLLHKPQVYRHLLFNRLEYRDSGIDTNVAKLGILLILFDVYVKWYRMEQKEMLAMMTDTPGHLLSYYVYILSLCCLEFLVMHITIRSAVSWLLQRQYVIFKYNYISTALIMSSFPKLLLILMIIWDYNQLEYSWLVQFMVLTSNAEALSVFLNIGYVRTCFILLLGLLAKVSTQLLLYQFDKKLPIWLL